MAKTIILYFSKTSTTEKVAEVIASKLGADVYQIVEAVPYTNADLNWNNPTSRANIEQGDESARPTYKGELPDLTSYDQVIIGHPIWWGRPPRIIQTVMENLNLAGKRVATFATSGGSTYSEAQAVIDQMVKNSARGRVLSNQTEATKWLASIGF